MSKQTTNRVVRQIFRYEDEYRNAMGDCRWLPEAGDLCVVTGVAGDSFHHYIALRKCKDGCGWKRVGRFGAYQFGEAIGTLDERTFHLACADERINLPLGLRVSEEKPTTGPWTVTGVGEHNCYPIQAGTEVLAWVHDLGRDRMAEQKANARLVASAPEMRARLEATAAFLEAWAVEVLNGRIKRVTIANAFGGQSHAIRQTIDKTRVEPVAELNAMLMASAPELLAELEKITNLPADDEGNRTIPAGFLDSARKVIAKARGGRS